MRPYMVHVLSPVLIESALLIASNCELSSSFMLMDDVRVWLRRLSDVCTTNEFVCFFLTKGAWLNRMLISSSLLQRVFFFVINILNEQFFFCQRCKMCDT